jgi:hypothetical protein
MSKPAVAVFICAALLLCAPAFAIDGQIVINQSTVMAAGGFPYIITQPGSYKLSGNLVVSGGTDGIDITASNVTIDLNGFTIRGPVTCIGQGNTLSCSSSVTGRIGSGIVSSGDNTTIRNGSVVGFEDGVAVEGIGNLVEEIHASGNIIFGITAQYAVVRRNTASLNGGGINLSFGTVIENVMVQNRSVGLQISGLYGSNFFIANGDTAVEGLSAVSQNNNACSGTTC